MPRIPPNVTDVVPSSEDPGNGEREELEFELLEAERSLSSLLTREAGQRYWLRWIALITGLIVISVMAVGLWHLVHNVFWGPFVFVSPAFSVAMIVAPILSITTITVTLFVGAFKRFEDKELEAMSNGASSAGRFISGG